MSMNNQYQEEKEYFDFIKELAEKSGELMGNIKSFLKKIKEKFPAFAEK